VVLLGIVCAQFGIFMADSIAAMGVALIVIYVSYRLGIRSVSVLLDTVPHDTNRRIIALLDSFKEVEHYHDLKVRAAGSEIFAEVNIHVRAELDTRYAHDIATKIEMMVAAEVPRCHLHVHIEPDDE
jgi:cation diffusion facilitator family transporter